MLDGNTLTLLVVIRVCLTEGEPVTISSTLRVGLEVGISEDFADFLAVGRLDEDGLGERLGTGRISSMLSVGLEVLGAVLGSDVVSCNEVVYIGKVLSERQLT